jgi:hypothetical protein
MEAGSGSNAVKQLSYAPAAKTQGGNGADSQVPD